MSTLSTCSTLLPHRGILGRDSARLPVSDKGAAGPVIQFFCTWEQNLRAFGSAPVVLLYFLADDTIELRQAARDAKPAVAFALASVGSGADLPMLQKRQRIAKCAQSKSMRVAQRPGCASALPPAHPCIFEWRFVLHPAHAHVPHVCRPGAWGSALERPFTAPASRAVGPQSDPKPPAGGSRPCRPPHGFYHWSDLAIGKPVVLAGMSLCIADADGAARAHFAANGKSIEVDKTGFDVRELLASARNVRCVCRAAAAPGLYSVAGLSSAACIAEGLRHRHTVLACQR
jgi:hypothetical protein